jgi:hypothetical protein
VKQQRSPDRIDVDDAWIRKELAEIPSDGRCGRLVGRTQIDEK